ncbi:arsenite methyltransferase [Stylonychia lemnae]|uniref:Arsenite methyltransferase n=1 Tax=Stylonychia lemnae TaxID=5949 RepID=A0A078AE03_STYLE|nr:arsenite methyltransferase [Stylonychia lemnae]|eukprot:CDW79757.1 arsenite methyltransferase [Stylonychia lemnae]
MDIVDLQKDVQNYYGKTITQTKDLVTNACCLADPGFSEKEQEILTQIHPEIIDKFYGCGSPIPSVIEGCTILDLGCGTGRDCYLASGLVGEKGKVIGVDMTDEQLEVARRHQEYHKEKFGYSESNVTFLKGTIEDLKTIGVEDQSVDVVISNCVINLSGDKKKVFEEIWRILKVGGELYFSDIFSDRRIPDHLRKDSVLWGECLSGALYVEDFRRMMQSVGFQSNYTVKKSRVTIDNKMVQLQVGEIKFYSITIRAFKIPEIEDKCEDYGQEAYYLGTVEGMPDEFRVDQTHLFKRGEPVRICKNFALIFKQSRLAPHFEVSDEQDHLGILDMPGVCDSTTDGCC